MLGHPISSRFSLDHSPISVTERPNSRFGRPIQLEQRHKMVSLQNRNSKTHTNERGAPSTRGFRSICRHFRPDQPPIWSFGRSRICESGRDALSSSLLRLLVNFQWFVSSIRISRCQNSLFRAIAANLLAYFSKEFSLVS